MPADRDTHEAQWEAEYREFEKTFEDLKVRIAKGDGVARGLRTLAKAGADRERVLTLLASAVIAPELGWRKTVKKKQASLTRIANRIRSVAEEVEDVANDPLCHGAVWLALLNPDVEVDVPNHKKLFPTLMLVMMRRYETYSRQKAKAFGKLLQKQADRDRPKKLSRLVNYVRNTTGRNFDDKLAQLLTDAHDAAGTGEQFTVDRIKKFRQRHTPKPSRALLDTLAPSLVGDK